MLWTSREQRPGSKENSGIRIISIPVLMKNIDKIPILVLILIPVCQPCISSNIFNDANRAFRFVKNW